MNDREILDVVYQTLKVSKTSSEKNTIYESRLVEDMLKFVDNERQTQAKQQSYIDVSEIERHRGLEIGPDGTVESVE